MGVELVVADAEFCRTSRQVCDAARTLEACASQLSALVRELYETKAIASTATHKALERSANDIAKMGRAIPKAVDGVCASTSDYVVAMDEMDDLTGWGG